MGLPFQPARLGMLGCGGRTDEPLSPSPPVLRRASDQSWRRSRSPPGRARSPWRAGTCLLARVGRRRECLRGGAPQGEGPLRRRKDSQSLDLFGTFRGAIIATVSVGRPGAFWPATASVSESDGEVCVISARSLVLRERERRGGRRTSCVPGSWSSRLCGLTLGVLDPRTDRRGSQQGDQ